MAGRRFNRISWAMENEAQIAQIKAKYTEFRVKGMPTGSVQQPARGSKVPVSLVPFCLYGYTNKYVVGMGKRANDMRVALGLSDADLNIDTGTGGTSPTGKKARRPYAPARAIITVPKGDAIYKADTGTTTTGQTVADDTDATPISNITGLKYNRRLANSYTVPFGADSTSGQQTQLEMQGVVYAKAARGGRSVSFKPEIPG